jgi:hypothetical protein
MSELTFKTIKITGVEKKVASNGSIFFNIVDGENKKFKLWKTVKDGSDSKAYTEFMKLPNDGLGVAVKAGIEEQHGDYQGKSIVYRTIKSLSTDLNDRAPQQNSVQSHISPVAKLSDEQALLESLKLASTILARLTSFIGVDTEKLSVIDQDIPEEEVIKDTDIPF